MVNTLSNKNEIVVRILNQGQYKINEETHNKIDEIDNSIVDIIEKINLNDKRESVSLNQDQEELRKRLAQIIYIVSSEGTQLDEKEIIESDIIIPNEDISVDEAKEMFRGEGIIKGDI